MASLWGDYTLFDGALSGLTLGTGVRYTGSSYGDPANSFKVGSYTVVDALVRYDLARVGMAGSNVALHVNNLFDREYVASCFNTYGCFWVLNVRLLPPRPSASNLSRARFAVPFLFKLADMQDIQSNPTPPLRSTISPFAYPGARCCIRSLDVSGR